MGKIIGIDLGTTTSEVAILENGKPKLLKDRDGNSIIPSVVAMEGNRYIIGGKAKNILSHEKSSAIAEIKREMGSVMKYPLGGEQYLPQEISAFILKHIKDLAEYALGEVVDEAVVTVPAMFNSIKRQATKHAAEIAGLKVERIINEPTAAALAYGLLNYSMDREERILVYDLGGGTFDVSILEMYDGILEVKCSRGDNLLGGKDFDERIIGYIIDEIYRIHEIDLRNNEAALRRIKFESEQAKIRLTGKDKSVIYVQSLEIPNSSEPLSIEIELTKTKFNLLVGELVRKTEQIVDEALKEIDLTDDDIDVVLLVGGSTKMDIIQESMTSRFGARIKRGINPDEAVAMGAAIQAGLKEGVFNSDKDLIPTDVCPYSMGTSVVASIGGSLVPGMMDILINKNTAIPTKTTRQYTTVHDKQTCVNVEVYEGEEKFAARNLKQGEFLVDGIPEDEAFNQEIEVTFHYDLNSTLKVDTKIISTGKKVSEVFCLKGMDQEEVETARKKLNNKYVSEFPQRFVTRNEQEKEENKPWELSLQYPEVKAILIKAEQLIPTIEKKKSDELKTAVDKLKKALTMNNSELINQYDEELTDLLFDIEL